MNNQENLKDKRVIVTGGTTGIGRATSLLLAQNGARLLIFGRHEKKLSDALEEISQFGEVHGLIADSSKFEDIMKVFAQADTILGGVDILINNAGLPAGSVIDTDHEKIDYSIQTMLSGYAHCAKEAISRMQQAGRGHIINIGSMSAEVFDPESDVYVAAKAGVRGFSISLRKKVNGDNIKVTLIEPGLVGTSLHKMPPAEERVEEEKNRMLTAEDIANTILWILTQPWRRDIIMLQIKPIGQIGI